MRILTTKVTQPKLSIVMRLRNPALWQRSGFFVVQNNKDNNIFLWCKGQADLLPIIKNNTTG
jgi:hypothetical protein